jgi:hypothetical protein
MKYFSENDTHINIECEKCGKVLKVKKERCINKSGIIELSPPLRCFCGDVCGTIYKNKKANNSNNQIKCSNCGSTQITAGNKGFGLGKAAVGGLLLGPVGLLGGIIGSKKVIVTCLNCGHKWNV